MATAVSHTTLPSVSAYPKALHLPKPDSAESDVGTVGPEPRFDEEVNTMRGFARMLLKRTRAIASPGMRKYREEA